MGLLVLKREVYILVDLVIFIPIVQNESLRGNTMTSKISMILIVQHR